MLNSCMFSMGEGGGGLESSSVAYVGLTMFFTEMFFQLQILRKSGMDSL